MMHHPNMHHQAMSRHPPPHLTGHQPISTHHSMPPPLHRENRHVTLTRVPLGPGAAGGGMAHAQPMGAMGGMPVHHPQRAPHPIRAMHHAPQHQHQHHAVTPQMKPMRRGYMGGGYMHTYHAPLPAAPSPSHSAHSGHSTQSSHSITATNIRGPLSPTLSTLSNSTLHSSDFSGMCPPNASDREPIKEQITPESPDEPAATDSALPNHDAEGDDDEGATGEIEATHPSSAQANSKEKTPMCLVNELARYNKIKHQYRLTSEQGPAHKKVFTVTLRLGDTEEYTAEGSSIKRAQHAAASAALAATGFPAPPPRAQHAHAPAHHHHRHSVMPTVELNALAMKLCQPAVYTSVPPVPVPVPAPLGPGMRGRACARGFIGFPRIPAPALVYRVRVAVGGRAWLGEGATPQGARHDAAARALVDLRSQRAPHAEPPPDPDADESSPDPLNSEVKSPVSLVHELALKRNMTVTFTVKSERGPPHMRVFVTVCTVGDMETEGEGNGKKVSKRRAAEKMLEEMKTRWPPAMLRPRNAIDKRRHQPTKKKPRNLIKEGGVGCAMSGGGSDNPISRLAVARHAVRARSPQYRVLEERGAARQREFLVQCLAPPHAATGLGPNKKAAKRRAAHTMEMNSTAPEPVPVLPQSKEPATGAEKATTDTKRKDSDNQSAGGANSEVRQPVPGVLMMDYHQRTGQPHQPNGVSETSSTATSCSTAASASGTGAAVAGGASPGAKDQLMYLAHLLGFTVQFSDFPKRNHGEYLSLVSLSTEPPVMCHGGGPSTAHSHEQCSRAALRALTLMGLDTMQNGSSSTGTKPITNGLPE